VFSNTPGHVTSRTVSLTVTMWPNMATQPLPLPDFFRKRHLYRAVFRSTFGTATTEVVTLTVDVPTAITEQPVPEAVRAGQIVTFTAAANGTTPKVQWQVSSDGGHTFTNIAGATSTTLRFLAAAKQKGYRDRAVFSNAVGQAIGDSAELVIW
jgi:hypothetical protein